MTHDWFDRERIPEPGLLMISSASACGSPKFEDSTRLQPSCMQSDRRCRQPMATRQMNGRVMHSPIAARNAEHNAR